MSVSDYIVDELAETIDDARPAIEQFARYSFATGTAIVLFDGLDEVLDVGSRRNYVEIVEQFANQFPATAVLVTSRHVGYTDSPLSPEFQCLSLAHFNEDEIKHYTRKLLSAIKGAKEATLDSEVQLFLNQTSRTARDLRENPLMLALMVWIFAFKGDVPSNRPEIYKECATLMFERWDQNRGIIAKIPRDFELIDLFGFVAHEIFGKPNLEEGVSREWLLSKMNNYFVRWYENKSKAHATASSLVDFLIGRAWVMSEVGPSVFKFTHRTFLEYFYAKYLNAQVDSVSELVRRLKFRIYGQQLDVVNHLSFQMFTFREPRKIHEAAIELTQLIGEDRENLSEISNALNFFARSLEYLLMSEQQFKVCVAAMCKRMIEVGSSGETFAAITLTHLCSNAGSRLPILASVASETFSRALRSQNEDTFDFIANIFSGGRLKRSNKPVNFVFPRITSRTYSTLMQDLKAPCLRPLERFAKKDAKIAALSVLLNPELLPSMYEIHGPLLLGKIWQSQVLGSLGLSNLLRGIGSQCGVILPETIWINTSSDTVGSLFLKILHDGFKEEKLPDIDWRDLSREIFSILRRARVSHELVQPLDGASLVGTFFLGVAVMAELQWSLQCNTESRASKLRANTYLRRHKLAMQEAIPKGMKHRFLDRAVEWANHLPEVARAQLNS